MSPGRISVLTYQTQGTGQKGSLHVEFGLGGAGTVADAGTQPTAELGCSLLLEGQVEACPLASCLSNLLSLHLGCCRSARPPFSSASAS